MNPIPVGILGATGMVGQRMVELLRGHPFFQISALAASERSADRPYAEAAPGRLAMDVPTDVAQRKVVSCSPDQMPGGTKIVLSALDSAVAGPIERTFAEAGFAVVSNASNHRMDPKVPLVIPEVNPD